MLKQLLQWREFNQIIHDLGRSPEFIVGCEIKQEVGAISEDGEFTPSSTRTGTLIVTFDDGYKHHVDIAIEQTHTTVPQQP
jgi:hypothetical protein